MEPPGRAPPLDDALRRLEKVGWCVVPAFLSAQQTRGLAEEALRLHGAGRFRAARVGRGPSERLRPDVRQDELSWFDPHAATARQRAFLAAMEELRLRLNAGLLLGLFDFECHYAVYPPGAFYAAHLDRFADAPLRTVSSVAYLNEAWTGSDAGQLRIHAGLPEGPVDIAPEAGTLVLFLSAQVLHEVLPTRRQRLSIAGWFRTRP